MIDNAEVKESRRRHARIGELTAKLAEAGGDDREIRAEIAALVEAEARFEQRLFESIREDQDRSNAKVTQEVLKSVQPFDDATDTDATIDALKRHIAGLPAEERIDLLLRLLGGGPAQRNLG